MFSIVYDSRKRDLLLVDLSILFSIILSHEKDKSTIFGLINGLLLFLLANFFDREVLVFVELFKI